MAISSAVGSFCVDCLLGLNISLLILCIGLAGVILLVSSSLIIFPVSPGMCGTLMPYCDVSPCVCWLSFNSVRLMYLLEALVMMCSMVSFGKELMYISRLALSMVSSW